MKNIYVNADTGGAEVKLEWMRNQVWHLVEVNYVVADDESEEITAEHALRYVGQYK